MFFTYFSEQLQSRNMGSQMYLKGIEKIFRGVLKYRNKYKEDMVSWFHHINENPKPTAIFMTCLDSR